MGVDEAGYGPNLGPLTIAASIWSVPLDTNEDDFLEAVAEFLQPKPLRAESRHIPVGDSKLLYDRSKGLKTLEFGLLAMASLISHHDNDDQPAGSPIDPKKFDAATLGQLAEVFGQRLIDRDHPKGPSTDSNNAAWYDAAARLAVPATDLPVEQLARNVDTVSRQLEAADIQLLGLRSRVITEAAFNASLHRSGSKGQILAEHTLAIVSECIAEHAKTSGAIECFCDRQGGRKNYLPVLLDAMPDLWFTELDQAPGRSSYACQSPQATIHFSVGGDRFPPTALASMLAKYLRERYMQAFNAFWLEHCCGIKPTAGYPVDAKRFAADIGPAAEKLNLPREEWWRMK